MSPTEAKAAVIEALISAGFVASGETRRETVRIPTTKSPLYGKSGGELATLGGRQRFERPGTNRRATVGKITTCFYEVDGREARNFVTMQTREVGHIMAYIGSMP